MIKTRLLVLGGICAGLTVLFQTIPVFLSEIFVIATIFSVLPVYIMARLNPVYGISTFITAAFIIFAISPHEGIFFLLTNGIIGLALGICRHYTNYSLLQIAVSSLSLATALIISSMALGINAFGFEITDTIGLEALVLTVFSFIYCTLYMKFANFIYTILKKSRLIV
jgi:hypothetical protein